MEAANSGAGEDQVIPTFPQGEGYPAYRSHKYVRAFKVARIESGTREGGNSWVIYPTDGSLPPYEVTHQWRTHFQPKTGGYIVFYRDGYVSYSPATAFEEGNTKIT